MSSTQRLANEMDLALFNLSARATRLSDDSRVADEKDRWAEIALTINRARVHTKAMMHPADLEKVKF